MTAFEASSLGPIPAAVSRLLGDAKASWGQSSATRKEGRILLRDSDVRRDLETLLDGGEVDGASWLLELRASLSDLFQGCPQFLAPCALVLAEIESDLSGGAGAIRPELMTELDLLLYGLCEAGGLFREMAG